MSEPTPIQHAIETALVKRDESLAEFCARVDISIGQYYLIRGGKRAGLATIRKLLGHGVITRRLAIEALIGDLLKAA